MDEQQRDRIHDDLRGLVRGDLLLDDISRTIYSTDASIFQVRPLGVVAPLDEEDVQAVVRYAAQNRLALVPRGAGSGLAGESLGTGLVMDLSRHLRSVIEVGPDWARVQPGVVYRDLSVRLAREGRRFAPDPASGAQCTIGGMLATNASGARCLRHGYTRDHVERLRAVLDTGDVTPVGREARWPGEGTPGHLHDIVVALGGLLEENADLVQSCQPRTPYNRNGYLLHDILGPGWVDVGRLLVGSEGTLAVFTEATLRTLPLPGGRGLALLGFASLEAALSAARWAVSGGPAACDLIDRRLLTVARGSGSEVAALVPAGAEVVMLVEYEAGSPVMARRAAADLAERARRDEPQLVHARVADNDADIDRFWGLREMALPSLYGMRGRGRPVAVIEDVGVPPEELPTYLWRLQEILKHYQTTASYMIHAGTGQVHARPFLDLDDPLELSKLWAIAEEVHRLALSLGGTISTQHGTGLARTPWVARQYGPLYPVLRQVKDIFDPQCILNPGKIVGPDPAMPAWPLRRTPPAILGPPAGALRWHPGEMRDECVNCNGCADCRTEEPARRMCPIFRATHAEAAAPRAKANVMRQILEGNGDDLPLSASQVRAVADLCVNCKMCALECPAHVNIPKLMLEAKAANAAEHGLDRADWAMARTEDFAAVGSKLAMLVNAALGNRTARWLLEKLLGLSRRRRLPTFSRRNFLARAAHRGWTRRPRGARPRVAYFVDVFANYNDPEIAEAAVAVLRHNGMDVHVPAGQIGCGMAPLAEGDVEGAREAAQSNLLVLAELAREGYPIICSEPTAALMLRTDYLDLMDDPDARLVSERVVELTTFLGDLHQRGRLRTDFAPLDFGVGHHVPCHLKALGGRLTAPDLLRLIPGLRVHTIDVGCSGMAGTFGFKAKNFAVSREAGRPMLAELARPAVLFGSTECSACRVQMEDGSGKRTLHPVQYLALAYGLMPQLGRRLRAPVGELMLS